MRKEPIVKKNACRRSFFRPFYEAVFTCLNEPSWIALEAINHLGKKTQITSNNKSHSNLRRKAGLFFPEKGKRV
ncbi:hypothetical protein J7E37_00120 [Bacillus sp. ISL-39]|nr:hypothetical protein [Bacillus sp. ISL-39]